jgi:hypothetical protein
MKTKAHHPKTSLLFLLIISFEFASAQQFTKITTGPIVNTPGDSRSVNWIDVNNDNNIDLFISN